jgi:hypothetical protein
MNKHIICASLTLCSILTACATGYQPKSFTGGYIDTKLSGGSYRVRYEGNFWTLTKKNHRHLLLRCAEITLKNGYDYFMTDGPVKGGAICIWWGGPTHETTIQLKKGKFNKKNPNVYDARKIIEEERPKPAAGKS